MELFANEGDTVSVGGNLFKIELGDNMPADAVPSKPSTPKPVSPEPVPTQAPTPQTPAPNPTSSVPPAAPIPVQVTSKASPAPSKISAPVLVSQDTDDFPGYIPGVRTERRVRFETLCIETTNLCF